MAKSSMKVGMKPQRARNKFLREAKEKRQFEAKVRQELADKRPVGEQIGRLDAGGYAAVKERAKLMDKLQKKLSSVEEDTAKMEAKMEAPVKTKKVRKAK